MRQLIINADDFGLNEAATRETARQISLGCITSATILANGSHLEEAIDFAKSHPEASFGVHLNISEGRCTGHGKDASGLISDGKFVGRPPTGSLRPHEWQIVFDEWRAQIDRLLQLGLNPSHIDGHHHVHTIPKYFPVLKRIQKLYGIECVRISKNLYASKASPFTRFAKVLWNSALRAMPPATRTTDFFTSFDDYRASVRLSDGTYELMCHPGNPAYEEETRALARMRPDPARERLISYHALVQG